MTEEQLREKLNDRIYLALQTMHKSKHLKIGCFCTTEISGAYQFSLESIDAYTTDLMSIFTHQLELAKIEAYKQGIKDGWNKSAEGDNCEYSMFNNDEDTIVEKVLKENDQLKDSSKKAGL